MEISKATFSAGCFWGVQEAFDALEGVLSTQVGYTGGNISNPSYEMVCSHKTGHAEAIQIEFNPTVIPYEKLLETFWKIHDPTSINRQGLDIGTQYRSSIFYHNEQQKIDAEQSKKDWEKHLNKVIVTEIVPATVFYRAEEYHQHYLRKKESSHE